MGGGKGSNGVEESKLCSLVQQQPGGLIRAAKQVNGSIRAAKPSDGSNYKDGRPGRVCQWDFRRRSWP